MDRRIKRNLGLHRSRTRTCVVIGNLTDRSVVDYLACDLWKDDYTSHLRGGAGSGRASCIGGATLNHRLNSTTPLTLMQIGE
ncbi:hypothetical protein PUN28_003952 [Cardiocondyla obscurior]|uniref:Uncharacterized protein n=1 Tax=Cardiocondyla obscurior TaxID=286306 RepID=A0AAW2GMP6_9HYME